MHLDHQLIMYFQHIFQFDKNETSELSLTGLLWWEYSSDTWIPHTKSQYYGKRLHTLP